jgi:hypothetical protein
MLILNKKEMIKNSIKVIIIASSIMLSSCYSCTSAVEEGAQANKTKTKWNHYLLFGLAPVSVSDSKEMAGGAESYDIHTRQTFVNGVISGVTFGLYTPTTTTVTK